jgi:D-methionine transport system permease protein
VETSLLFPFFVNGNEEPLIERLIDITPALLEALYETGIMMIFAMLAALLIGLPVGTLLFLCAKGKPLENRWIYGLFNIFVNVTRSFPFLLLVISLNPVTRYLYGRATGNPYAASFPMMIIAVALYARFVEQSLLDVPRTIIETAYSMGANMWQLVWKFLYVEARSSLVVGFVTACISFVSYSTIMGVVGGGGIGDFAIRYGYQRFQTDIMYYAIVVIIILVELFQWLGLKLAKKIDKR